MSVTPQAISFIDGEWYNNGNPDYEYRYYTQDSNYIYYTLYIIVGSNAGSLADVNHSHQIKVGIDTQSSNYNLWFDGPDINNNDGNPHDVVNNADGTVSLYRLNNNLKGKFIAPTEASWISSSSGGSGTNNNNSNNNSSGPVVIKTIDITPTTPPNSDPVAWYAQWYVENGQNYVFVLISQTTNLSTTNVIPLMKDKLTGVNISPTATVSSGDDSSTIVVIFEVDLDDLRNNYIQVYENTGVVPADGNPLLGSFDMHTQRRKVSCNFW